MGVTVGGVELARVRRPTPAGGSGELRCARSSAAGLTLATAPTESATVPASAGASAVLTDRAHLITDVVAGLPSGLGTPAAAVTEKLLVEYRFCALTECSRRIGILGSRHPTHARRHIHRGWDATDGIE